MRTVKLATLIGIVLVSFVALLLAGSYAVLLPYLAQLEAGERGVVPQMLEKGMAQILEDYHLRHIESARISLPALPAATGTDAPAQAERFFYVDAQGNIIIRGLSDGNIPQDLSQKCLLFADKNLTWFKLRLLLDAFISERIRYVYLAALTPEGKPAFLPFEITSPGAFPMLYPFHVVILNNQVPYFNHEEAKDLRAFKSVGDRVRKESIAPRPFVRILSEDKVSCGTFFSVLAMCEASGVKPLVKLRTDDREFIIAEEVELHAPRQPQQQEEEK